jgi:hypothetical protein
MTGTRCKLSDRSHCPFPVVRHGYCADHAAALERDIWNGDREAHAAAAARDREVIDLQINRKGRK